MLPREHRMVRSADFSATARHGRRSGDGVLVVHWCAREDDSPTRIGFIVSRAVGGAVVRNRVRRRLRSVVRGRLDRLQAAERVVVRALPASAEATQSELSESFDRCLSKVVGSSTRVRRATAAPAPVLAPGSGEAS